MYNGYITGLMHRYETPVQYFLSLDEELVSLNHWVGHTVTIAFEGNIRCVHCGRSIKKTFNNGSCYPCFTTRADNDLCIVKPHTCHWDQGTCRDEAFAKTYCMFPHTVYLSLSSGAKVGITRKGNERKRWVDQGAVQAVPIAETPNRKLAGELEFHLSQFIADKTDWRKMLKGQVGEVDLLYIQKKMVELVPESFQPYLLEPMDIQSIVFPYEQPLMKVSAFNLDKAPTVTGVLLGMKGSYLIFEQGVLNIRKYFGYKITISAIEADQLHNIV
jgi:hypothetical protein